MWTLHQYSNRTERTQDLSDNVVRPANRYLNPPLYLCLKLCPVFHHQAEKQPSRPKEYVRYSEGFPPAPASRRWGRGKVVAPPKKMRATLLTLLIYNIATAWLGKLIKQSQLTYIRYSFVFFLIFLNNQPTLSALHTSRLKGCKHFTGRDKNIQGKSRLTETLTAPPGESDGIFFTWLWVRLSWETISSIQLIYFAALRQRTRSFRKTRIITKHFEENPWVHYRPCSVLY